MPASTPAFARSRRPWLAAAALGYPLALLALVLLFRFVGERWWVICAALYLPRLIFAIPLLPLAILLLRRKRWRLLSAQVVSLALVLFPLLGFVLPAPSRAQPGAPTIRVLSYNVMHAYAGASRIVDEIDEFRPDVVLLQKLVANVEPVTALLRARYPVVEAADGFVVASRFPVVSRFDPAAFGAPDRSISAGFIQRVLATPVGPIAIYDVHPTSPRVGLFAFRGSRAIAASVREESELRVRQVRAFAARADAETVPVLIAGDTNVPGLSPLWHRELARYQDGFEAAGWGFGYTFPFNLSPWMRIDRILASPELRFVGFQNGHATASDHLCVVADIQRSGNDGRGYTRPLR
jgi:endonuclease/exonuclease/phosphatase (EEP) superfamily protein YafD